MPPKKSKGSIRRRPKKAFRNGNNKTLAQVGYGAGRSLFSNFGFPDRCRVRLAYGQQFAIASSTISGTQTFRGGSCYDPDYTGGGNQPSDYDLYATRYFRYKVHASYIKVITYSSIDTALTMRFALIPTNNTTVVINTPDMLVNDRVKAWITTGAIAKTMVHQAKSTTIMGNRGLITDDTSSLTSGSPTEDWYWHISYQSYDGSSSVTKYMDVQIVYDVEFFDKALQDTDLLEKMVAYRANWEKYKTLRAVELKERKIPEAKLPPPRTVLKAVAPKFTSTDIPISESKETKGEPSLKKATEPSATQLGLVSDGEDDEDEAEFLAYIKSKFKARSQAKQAWVFENADFSGTRTGGSST